MHRFAHRLFGSEAPPMTYSTDGAEMGKQMVAEGLGVTLLLVHRRADHVPPTVRDLGAILVARARASGEARDAAS